MVATPSAMVPLGTKMPTFSLPSCTGEIWFPREESAGKLVIFICNHCPFVIHIAETLCSIDTYCRKNNIEMVGINANDIQAYPDDSPEKMVLAARNFGWLFPYLFDESQVVATQFSATCTPDTFLYDADCKLFYRGQLDDSRPNSGESTGKDLIEAIGALTSGKSSPMNQQPAIGCNIKWK